MAAWSVRAEGNVFGKLMLLFTLKSMEEHPLALDMYRHLRSTAFALTSSADVGPTSLLA